MATTTLPHPAPKCFAAILYDMSVVLTKDNDRIVVVTPDGDFVRFFEIEDATFCTILGEIGVADAQALADKRHGGFAMVACTRHQEIQ